MINMIFGFVVIGLMVFCAIACFVGFGVIKSKGYDNYYEYVADKERKKKEKF